MMSPASSNGTSGYGDLSPLNVLSGGPGSGSPPHHNPVYPFQNSPLATSSVGSAGQGNGGDSGSESGEDGNNGHSSSNLDAIAGVLFQHPSIQMALNDSLNAQQ